MARAWWVIVICVSACKEPKLDPKLEYKLTTIPRKSKDIAHAKDVVDLTPSLNVSGPPEGAYLTAIRGALASQPNVGIVKVQVAGTEPGPDSGTFGTRVILDARWWALPDVFSLRDELVIDVRYRKKSHAELGQAVGEIVAKHLDELRPANAAVPSPVTSSATAVATGETIACSLHADKSVHCWGAPIEGLVGEIPTKIPLPPAIAIAAGSVSMCAILEDGTVRCVGEADAADPTGHRQPTRVCGLPKATQLSIDGRLACAITMTRDVYCWSTKVANASDCTPAGVMHHVDKIAGASGATHIDGSCVLVGGKAMCWKEGQLAATPAGLPGGVDVQYGSSPCVIEASGQIACDMPKNYGTTIAPTPWDHYEPDVIGSDLLPPPPTVRPGSKVVLYSDSGCAIAPDAQLSCWGLGGTPRPVLADVVSVDLAEQGGCAVTKDGAVQCWGRYYLTPYLPESHAKGPTKVTIF